MVSLALVQRGAQEAWSAERQPFLHLVAEYGPWVLAGLLAIVLVRSALRIRRYRAVAVLGASEQEAVHAAVRDAESRTIGEIVPVVVERSDAHAGAAWVCALVALLLGSALLERFLPWSEPHWLLAAQLGLGAAGFLLARTLPDLERLFVPPATAREVAEEQALIEFHVLGLRETRERTGVLLFVSLFEHQVVVLGDSGIHAKVGDEHWKRTRDAVLAGIARGSVRDGLVDGVRACGAILAEHFPVRPGDTNEIQDRVIVRAR